MLCTASVRSTSTVSIELLKDCVWNLSLDHWLPQRKSRLGRRGHSPKSLFLALLLQIREQIPSDQALARKLQEN